MNKKIEYLISWVAALFIGWSSFGLTPYCLIFAAIVSLHFMLVIQLLQIKE